MLRISATEFQITMKILVFREYITNLSLSPVFLFYCFLEHGQFKVIMMCYDLFYPVAVFFYILLMFSRLFPFMIFSTDIPTRVMMKTFPMHLFRNDEIHEWWSCRHIYQNFTAVSTMNCICVVTDNLSLDFGTMNFLVLCVALLVYLLQIL